MRSGLEGLDLGASADTVLYFLYDSQEKKHVTHFRRRRTHANFRVCVTIAHMMMPTAESTHASPTAQSPWDPFPNTRNQSCPLGRTGWKHDARSPCSNTCCEETCTSAAIKQRRRSAADARLVRLHLMREKSRRLYLDAVSLVQRVKADKIDPRGVIRTKLRTLRSYVTSSRDYRLCKKHIDMTQQMERVWGKQKKEHPGKGLRRRIIGDRQSVSV